MRTSTITRFQLLAIDVIVLLFVFLAGPALDAAEGKKSTRDEAEVVGRVVDQSGTPAPGVQVTITSKAVPDFRAEATTDKDGVFSLKVEHPDGQYSFYFEGDGYMPFDDVGPLIAGERSEMNIRLLDVQTGRRQEAVKAFNEGVQAFDKADNAVARAEFLKASELDSALPEPHLGLAQVAYRENKLVEASVAIERYLGLRNNDTAGLTLALGIYRELGNQERMNELIEALADTEKRSSLAVVVYNQGAAAAQAGDSELAITKFKRAAELDPDMALAYTSLATMYYNVGGFEQIHAALDKLLALDDLNVKGRRLRYLSYDAVANTEMAGKALDAYIAVDPDGAVDVMYQRAELEFQDHGPAGAVAALEKIIKLRPDHARAHYTLGLCFSSIDKTKTRLHLERFLELTPDDADAAVAREILDYL